MQCSFKLTGITPLLMHADDVLMADELKTFRDNQPKGKSVKGDDRSPPWTWHTYVYHDGEYLTWPSENMMSCIRWSASKVILKGNKNYKELSQSGLLIPDCNLKFQTKKGQVPFFMINAWRKDDTPFMDQSKQLTEFDPDISLFVKRASNKNSGSKNVRVRPRFESWSIEGKILITSQEISFEKLTEFFSIAGDQAGLGDWRPSSKTPGPYGRFKAEVKLVKK